LFCKITANTKISNFFWIKFKFGKKKRFVFRENGKSGKKNPFALPYWKPRWQNLRHKVAKLTKKAANLFIHIFQLFQQLFGQILLATTGFFHYNLENVSLKLPIPTKCVQFVRYNQVHYNQV